MDDYIVRVVKRRLWDRLLFKVKYHLGYVFLLNVLSVHFIMIRVRKGGRNNEIKILQQRITTITTKNVKIYFLELRAFTTVTSVIVHNISRLLRFGKS